MLSPAEKIPVVKLNSLEIENFYKLRSSIDTNDNYTRPRRATLMKPILSKRDDKKYKCLVCKQECGTEAGLVDHVKTHTNEDGFKCEVCGKSFTRPSNLKKHEATHGSSGGLPKCRYCDYVFASKLILERHEKLHLNFREFIKTDSSLKQEKSFKFIMDSDSLNKVDVKSEITQCSICHKKFPRSEIHVIGHSYRCKECAKEMLKPGKIIRQEFVYIVGDPTDFQDDLSEDKLEDVYTPVKSYECEVCEKTFLRNVDLQRHVKTHKNATKSVKTTNKPPVAAKSPKLQHKCTKCAKAFATKTHLLEHLKLHAGEKPFQCQVCSYTFARAYNLRRHEKTHELQKCETCSKSFSKDEFAKHGHKEKKHACDMCDKRFSKRRILKKHKLLHVGIRCFECATCEKLFSQEQYLEAHRKLHDEAVKLQCIVCEEVFASESCLKEHVSVH